MSAVVAIFELGIGRTSWPKPSQRPGRWTFCAAHCMWQARGNNARKQRAGQRLERILQGVLHACLVIAPLSLQVPCG